MWRNWNPSTFLVEYKMLPLLWETVWRFLEKLNTELPCDPAITLLYVPRMDNKYSNKYLCMNVHCSTIGHGQSVETAQRSINCRALIPAPMGTDHENIMLRERSWTQKVASHRIPFLRHILDR